MSHQLSLACYQNAKKDAAVPLKQYEDLESLVGLFGLTDSDRHSAQGAPVPDRFEFMSQAPTLLIVEDEAGLADMLRVSLVRKGYPQEAVLVFPSGEEAIFYAQFRSTVHIATSDGDARVCCEDSAVPFTQPDPCCRYPSISSIVICGVNTPSHRGDQTVPVAQPDGGRKPHQSTISVANRDPAICSRRRGRAISRA